MKLNQLNIARVSPLGGWGAPVSPIILYLQGGPVFSGKIHFTNSAYSLSVIII